MMQLGKYMWKGAEYLLLEDSWGGLYNLQDKGDPQMAALAPPLAVQGYYNILVT